MDGLRERKKVVTRKALGEAALRLALEHGPDNVRVDDIAEAAGVSPRTYNNYFSSREQAIVAAITAERALRVGAALRARPAGEPLAEAVTEAIVEQYSNEPTGDALTLITSTPSIQAQFAASVSAIEHPLAAAIAARTRDELAATVLAAAVCAAARIAIQQWAEPTPSLLLVPNGSLTEKLREALAYLA